MHSRCGGRLESSTTPHARFPLPGRTRCATGAVEPAPCTPMRGLSGRWSQLPRPRALPVRRHGRSTWRCAPGLTPPRRLPKSPAQHGRHRDRERPSRPVGLPGSWRVSCLHPCRWTRPGRTRFPPASPASLTPSRASPRPRRTGPSRQPATPLAKPDNTRMAVATRCSNVSEGQGRFQRLGGPGVDRRGSANHMHLAREPAIVAQREAASVGEYSELPHAE